MCPAMPGRNVPQNVAQPPTALFSIKKRTSAKLSWTQHNKRATVCVGVCVCVPVCVPGRLSNWFQLTLATAPTQLQFEAHSYKYFTFLRLRVERALAGKSSLWRRTLSAAQYTNPIPKIHASVCVCVCAGISHAHFVVIRNANWQSLPAPAATSPGCSLQNPVESLAQYMINIP